MQICDVIVVTGFKPVTHCHGLVSKSDFRKSEVGPTVYRNGSRFSRVLFGTSCKLKYYV